VGITGVGVGITDVGVGGLGIGVGVGGLNVGVGVGVRMGINVGVLVDIGVANSKPTITATTIWKRRWLFKLDHHLVLLPFLIQYSDANGWPAMMVMWIISPADHLDDGGHTLWLSPLIFPSATFLFPRLRRNAQKTTPKQIYRLSLRGQGLRVWKWMALA
jgi:hypothetical protein